MCTKMMLKSVNMFKKFTEHTRSSSKILVFRCAYHQGMDERVEKDKDPNGGGHVAHASPHAHHGSGVMVGLQCGAEFALGENDQGVEDLIKLAQVEDPAIVCEALVPKTASLGVGWVTVAS